MDAKVNRCGGDVGGGPGERDLGGSALVDDGGPAGHVHDHVGNHHRAHNQRQMHGARTAGFGDAGARSPSAGPGPGSMISRFTWGTLPPNSSRSTTATSSTPTTAVGVAEAESHHRRLRIRVQGVRAGSPRLDISTQAEIVSGPVPPASVRTGRRATSIRRRAPGRSGGCRCRLAISSALNRVIRGVALGHSPREARRLRCSWGRSTKVARVGKIVAECGASSGGSSSSCEVIKNVSRSSRTTSATGSVRRRRTRGSRRSIGAVPDGRRTRPCG